MKILKIFGIVVGIHVFALILIFANPGCSSSSRRTPQPTDTLPAETGPTVTVPDMTPAPSATPVYDPASPVIAPATPAFNPDAPATYAGSTSAPAIRFAPIRPNTPAASAVTAAPVENVTPATTYTVRPGDSLWSVAKRHHTTVKDLTAANNLRSSATLREGQKLLIPAKSAGGGAAATASSGRATSAAAPVTTPPAPTAARTEGASRPTSDEFKYVVKPGETLGAIARKFDVRTRDLAVANHISDPRNLRAGTELVIPGWQSANARNGATAGSGATTTTPAPAPETPQQPPNILEDSANAPAGDANVPVINLDDPVTPAPKS